MKISSKIAGVGIYVPKRKIDNSQVLEMLLSESKTYLNIEDYDLLSYKAQKKMEKAGCNTRYWCDENEYCTDIALKASLNALEDASLDAGELDYIIFTGISKAFVEPATSHVLRSELGNNTANVIDTQDACASFVKSIQIGDSLIKTGVCKNVLIVSGERTFDWADFKCTSIEDLNCKFGSLTIGDAAGAVILQATEDPVYCEVQYHFDYTFNIINNTYSYCHIGLNHKIGERYKLKSNSRKLFETANEAGWRMVINRMETDKLWTQQKFDHVIFHDIGRYIQEKVVPAFKPVFPNSPGSYYSYFSEFGNVASASFPLGLSLSVKEGKVKRGDNVMFVCPAAGVQSALFSFIY